MDKDRQNVTSDAEPGKPKPAILQRPSAGPLSTPPTSIPIPTRIAARNRKSSLPELPDLPSRQQSLRARISNGDLVTSPLGSSAKITRLTDFTKPGGTSSQQDQASPNFSVHRTRMTPRPRVSSGASSQTAAANASKSATRFPIAVPNKASSSELKRSGSSLDLSLDTDDVPSFGTRRLMSPDALNILDQGPKRYATKRAGRSASDSTSFAYSASEVLAEEHSQALLAGRQLSTDLKKSGLSQDDVFTVSPKVPQPRPVGLGLVTSKANGKSGGYRPTIVGSDGVDRATRKPPPPSRSPHTEPLATIPSQAMFPAPSADSTHDESTINAPKMPSTPSHGDGLPRISSDRMGFLGNKSTTGRYAAATSQTQMHIDRTLSLLEGEGTPPRYDIDDKLMEELFGDRDGHARKSPEDEAHSDMSSNTEAKQVHEAEASNEKGASADTACTASSKKDNAAASSKNTEYIDQAQSKIPVSKWSSTTPSSKGTPPQQHTVRRHKRNVSSSVRNTRPTSIQKGTAKGQPGIAKRASRIPSPRRSGQVPVGSSAMGQTLPKRRSSIRQPPWEPVTPERKRYYRALDGKASVDTKNTEASADLEQRSRSQNQTVVRFSKANQRQEKYADLDQQGEVQRSRSRAVIDRINGLFNKRDKKDAVESEATIGMIYPRARMPADKIPGKMSKTRTPRLVASSAPSQTRDGQRVIASSSKQVSRATDESSLADTMRRLAHTTENLQFSLLEISEMLANQALCTDATGDREQLLGFAKILVDTVHYSKLAQIETEKAKAASTQAQLASEMIQNSLEYFRRLGVNLAQQTGAI